MTRLVPKTNRVLQNTRNMPMLKPLTSRNALIVSLIAILGTGLAFWWLDGVRDAFFRSVIVAYVVAAIHHVAQRTPALVARMRPVVLAPDATFETLARRVIGARLNPLLKLLAPTFACGWLASLLLRLALGAAVEMRWHFTLTELLMPLTEVIFSLAMIWRMFNLARLASQKLDINLFDPRAVYPFGELSFAYASVISVRMLLQILLLGSAIGGVMAAIFSLAAVASLLALILPIWPVHLQMVRAQIGVLLKLDGELNALTRHLFLDAHDTEDVSYSAAQVMAIGAMRDRIYARWTWPVPDSVTAVQAVALSASPTLLSTAKSYLLPALGLG